jgi:hypothetical protein
MSSGKSFIFFIQSVVNFVNIYIMLLPNRFIVFLWCTIFLVVCGLQVGNKFHLCGSLKRLQNPTFVHSCQTSFPVSYKIFPKHFGENAILRLITHKIFLHTIFQYCYKKDNFEP